MNTYDEIAHAHIREFLSSRSAYMAERERLCGTYPHYHRSVALQKIRKGAKNILRYAGDLWRRAIRRETLEDVKESELTISVLRRDQFLKTPLFDSLYGNRRNHRFLKAFMDQELFQEVQCSHFLALKGMSVNELHILIEHMGQNPRAFLSDDRGENGGRIAIDNTLIDGKHPFLAPGDGRYDEELPFWQPIWPKISKRSALHGWMVSRTHGVIYRFNAHERDILIIPIHVDPKNVVMFFGELFGSKHVQGQSALSYHQIPVGEPEYIGTGLYRLGCHVFIHMMTAAFAQGLMKNLVVEGAREEIEGEVSIIESMGLSRREQILLQKSSRDVN